MSEEQRHSSQFAETVYNLWSWFECQDILAYTTFCAAVSFPAVIFRLWKGEHIYGTIVGQNPSNQFTRKWEDILVMSSNSWGVTGPRAERIGVNLRCLLAVPCFILVQQTIFILFQYSKKALKKTQPKLGTCKIKTHDLFFSLPLLFFW